MGIINICLPKQVRQSQSKQAVAHTQTLRLLMNFLPRGSVRFCHGELDSTFPAWQKIIHQRLVVWPVSASFNDSLVEAAYAYPQRLISIIKLLVQAGQEDETLALKRSHVVRIHGNAKNLGENSVCIILVRLCGLWRVLFAGGRCCCSAIVVNLMSGSLARSEGST